MSTRTVETHSELYDALFVNGTAIGLLIDPDSGAIVDASKRACRYYGYSSDEITSMTIHEINVLSPDEIEAEMDAAAAESRNHFVFQHRKKSGEVRHVEVYSSPVTIGRQKRLHSIIFDIEEKYRAEDALAAERHQLRSILNSLPVGVYIADPETYELLYVNPYLRALYGENITGKRCYESIHDRKATCPFCTNNRLSDDGTLLEWDYHNAVLNRDFYVLDRLIRWNDGRNVRFEVAIDITDRKRTEEMLRRLNRTKEKLLSVLAHDLRVPFLNAISLLSVLDIDFETMGRSKRRELIGEVRGSIEATHELLVNLLEWSRNQSEEIEFHPVRFPLIDTIDSLMAVLRYSARRKGIDLNCQIDPDIEVFGDIDMIMTTIRNLVSNAIKFTQSGGTVSVHAVQTDEKLRIGITDTGVGMSAEKIETLFDDRRNSRTRGTDHEPGLGLGLTICNEFVHRHGGSLEVSSTPGAGSTFAVVIPGRHTEKGPADCA